MTDLLRDLWMDFVHVVNAASWRDLLDIAIIAFLIYQAIKLIRETRAAQLVKGIGILLVLTVLANTLKLRTMRFLTDNVLAVGLFALVVVFQPELRRALEQVGRSRIGKFQVFSSVLEQDVQQNWVRFIQSMGDILPTLSRQKVGALIVIEQQTRLGEIIKTGTIIDSSPSPELIGNVFFPNSPLHDGAMIVRNGRLHAAGCFLPLSDNTEISRELGTRHRAALGMSEASDAFVVVVSEETGLLSVCCNGKLTRGVELEELLVLLQGRLLPEKAANDKRGKTV